MIDGVAALVGTELDRNLYLVFHIFFIFIIE